MKKDNNFLPGFSPRKKKQTPLITGAEFSDDRKYRYALWRTWAEGKGVVAFVGLNPSTADEVDNDPTIRRCINYAKTWRFGGIVMLNLFAFRATDPGELKWAGDPFGPMNDYWLEHYYDIADLTVCAWGNDGSFRGRDQAFLRMLYKAEIWEVNVLKITGSGQPGHPLYLPKDLKPFKVLIQQTKGDSYGLVKPE